jgi:uncharacterized membrane protein YphA (DoxX/SURF4 family)
MRYDVQKDIRSYRVEWYIYVIIGLVTSLVAVVVVALLLTVATAMKNDYNKALDTCMNKGHSKEYCVSILN